MFKSCFTKILDIIPHPNPETTSLAVAKIYGFEVIIKKNSMNIGDIVYYIPIDSVLEKELEELIFPSTSKIKLNNSRIRLIRLKGYPSYGLIVETSLILSYLKNKGYNINPTAYLEKDLSSLLGITKFEPPIPKYMQNIQSEVKIRKSDTQPLFHSYNGLENIKWYPDLFKSGEIISVQLKLHGTNARMSMLPTVCNTLWKKFKKLFGLLSPYEIRYGSNNVDITAKSGNYKGYYGEDIYGIAFKNCNAAYKIYPNEIIYGEVIGQGIQKNYHYGHTEPTFVLFDVKVFDEKGEWRWLSPKEVEAYAEERNFQFVKVLYEGPYSKEVIDTFVSGKDDYFPEHVKEGIVIKSIENYNDLQMPSKKKALKYINPEYLENKSNTDFH